MRKFFSLEGDSSLHCNTCINVYIRSYKLCIISIVFDLFGLFGLINNCQHKIILISLSFYAIDFIVNYSNIENKIFPDFFFYKLDDWTYGLGVSFFENNQIS